MMPELPDLELFAENLRKHLLKKTLTKVTVYDIFRVTAVENDFNAALAGKCLDEIERDGKELFFHYNDAVFSVHLMLNGSFSLHPSGENLNGTSFKCAAFTFGESVLLVSDPGKMCKVTLSPVRSVVPDVFSDSFTKDYFFKKLAGRKKMSAKEFLIDQKILRGIGNAYADEILYESRIAPDSICALIPAERAEELYSCIASVLRNAVNELHARTPDAISGERRDFLKVHRRDLQKTESGAAIHVSIVGGKKTYFTDEQIRYTEGRLF